MTEASSPSLPAIRERAQAWQEEQAAAAACGWKWTGPPEVPGLWEEVAFLLALIARLQGERERARRCLRDMERELDQLTQTFCEKGKFPPDTYETLWRLERDVRAARAAPGEE